MAVRASTADDHALWLNLEKFWLAKIAPTKPPQRDEAAN
jgi:hypothetical protein